MPRPDVTPATTKSVAFPRILGPATLQAVLITAITAMSSIRGRSGASSDHSRRTAPRKSSDRSVGTPKPPGPPVARRSGGATARIFSFDSLVSVVLTTAPPFGRRRHEHGALLVW